MAPFDDALESGYRDHAIRRMTVAARAWRGITFRQWIWTTAIALVLMLAYVVGILPPLLRIVPNLVGRQPPVMTAAQLVSFPVVTLAAAYCFLLAVSIVEHESAHGLAPVRRYVAAGIGACIAAIVMEMLLYVLVPALAPINGGLALLLDAKRLGGWILWSAANFGLSGGLALAVYVRFQSARRARETFNAMELERISASRELLASRLEAMRARIEPQFLLGTLAQVEALYDRDPEAGDRMLDGLIAYLHAALPQLRSDRSTLKQEIDLAESYLGIVKIRMGSRLDFLVEVPSELGDCEFPPMLLLPLIDNALRHGLEPLPHGGRVVITAASGGDSIQVRVVDNGLAWRARSGSEATMATLQERLAGLYGDAARLEAESSHSQGVAATIEVPFARARDPR